MLGFGSRSLACSIFPIRATIQTSACAGVTVQSTRLRNTPLINLHSYTTCLLRTSRKAYPSEHQRRSFSSSQFALQSSRIPNMASATTFFDFTPKDKRTKEYPLSQHKGKVILAVNTASKCGFTPQFKGLEELWKSISQKYPDQFVILGFPCNQFGGQDPGSDDQIQEFCQLNYGVSFPVLGKTDVNGGKAEPVWEWMKGEKTGLLGLKRVKWNFEKFLIDRNGKVVQRWGSISKPETLEKDIIAQIEKKG